jgi:hypothetical protein
MQNYFLVPDFELKPQVYVEVTSNWIQLTLRYVVEPKKRRQAKTFIFTHVFERLQGRKDIMIASETMDLAIHRSQPTASTEKSREQPSKAA